MGETTKLHRVNTYLTDDEKALLEHLAKQRGLTLSALLRTLVLREAAMASEHPGASNASA